MMIDDYQQKIVRLMYFHQMYLYRRENEEKKGNFEYEDEYLYRSERKVVLMEFY